MDEGTLVADRFRIVALAGKGGFGSVYRVLDERTGQPAALKIFDRAQAELARFEREASLLKQLKHPQIVEFVEHGFTASGTAYIAMEWLTGCDLEQRLRQGPLSQAETLTLGLRAAQGLAAAHAQGLVHRDIKPSNLFLVDGQAEQVKLLDFGIARKEHEESKLTQTGAIVGTPGYMAPEQAAGARELTPRVDVFALGCVLFECLTGAQVFVGDDARAVLSRTINEPVPRLSHWLPDAEAGLDALLARMMARDPFARFPDGSALVLAISDVVANPALSHFASAGVAAVSSDAVRTVSRLYVGGGAQAAATARQAALAYGGELDGEEQEAFSVRFGLASAPETAQRAVLCALTLVSSDSSLRTAVLSSRDAAAIAPTLLAESAALAGAAPESGRVLVDTATANLLGRAFAVSHEGGATWVSGQLPARPRSTGVYLGRSRELTTLAGIFAEISEESCARLVVVRGEAGIGKSQLLETFAARLEASDAGCVLLWSQADTPTGASPFELARSFVKQRHGALLDVDATGNHFIEALLARGASRLDAESLLELVSPGRTGGKQHIDPLITADRMRSAWLTFVELEVAQAPLVLIAEDVHLADVASLRLLGAAVGQLAERPLLVLASTRAEDEALWDPLKPERLTLQPFRPQLAAELVRALHPELPPPVVDRIVERAGGSPIRLRELSRSSAQGEGETSLDTTFEARILSLPGPVARAVRAGSVFGLRFVETALVELVGDALPRQELTQSLAAAVRAGVLRLTRDALGEAWYSFSHALLQEAAYSQLPELDLRTAHRAAGVWLASTPGPNPSIVAWHFRQAGETKLALPWFEAALRAALVGGEPKRAMALAEEALSCAEAPQQLAAITVLHAEAAMALANPTQALRSAQLGLERARPGSMVWVKAAGVAIHAAGQSGQNEEVSRLGSLVLDVEVDADADAQAGRVICLCQAATQLLGAGRIQESNRFAAAVSRDSSPRPEAQAAVAHVEASYAFRVPDYELSAEKTGESARLHALGGNLRASALLRIFRASALIYAADADAANQELDAAEALARRTGADYYVRWTRYTRGKLLALMGDPWQARDHLQQVRQDLAGSPRIVAGAHIFAGLAALRAKDGAWAESEAQSALAAHQAPSVQAVAHALLARSKVLQGLPDEAVTAARHAQNLLDSAGGVEENQSLIFLALPEALAAQGRPDEARPLAAAALKQLVDTAARHSNPRLREIYLNEIEVHAATLQLAHRLGVGVAP